MVIVKETFHHPGRPGDYHNIIILLITVTFGIISRILITFLR